MQSLLSEAGRNRMKMSDFIVSKASLELEQYYEL